MFYKNCKGSIESKNVLLCIAALIVCFLLYKIIPFYYYYFEIKNQMVALSKLASDETDIEIKEKLYEKIKYLKIPANKDDIVIKRTKNKIKISLHYEEVLFITIKDKDYDLYIFNFSPSASNEIKG